MAPEQGLVHPTRYDVKDSNVELINSDLDHKVKYSSAETEPAWNDGHVGLEPGLRVWRIEQFEVVPWPKERYGEFYDGDSYIVLHSYSVDQDGEKQEPTGEEGEEETEDKAKKLGHEIFFWLGKDTTQDEAGTAAYKTVELDEFLHGAATQHREIQESPSGEFVSLFPRLIIRRGGVRSGFTHVETDAEAESAEKQKQIITLLRIFKQPGVGRASTVFVHEVEPTWKSLDDDDVFVLETGEKIWVWQGKKCSPIEKAKGAQIVSDLTVAKHIETEVLSQEESRSHVFVKLLAGEEEEPEQDSFSAPRPISFRGSRAVGSDDASTPPLKLFKLSDESGRLRFDLVKEAESLSKGDFEGDAIFVVDTGKTLWAWEGANASHKEKASWLKVISAYARHVVEQTQDPDQTVMPVARTVQGHESRAFLKAIASH
ncbi:Gelsolin [Ascosphaera apis ARSEF 7405]|uniref:Gelsolin n=1 Tax=Ascosphaera apis ARSEF 7405 TaxID=392613 RepID=A0A162I5F2_9EURO|nr:Gelsolin [Ascosphaera apis ARSEF 7405]